MMPDIHWQLFQTEIGLIVLVLVTLVLDIFLKYREKRGQTLTNIAMAGVSFLGVLLCFQWNHFGSSFNGSFVQDGVSFFFL